MISVTILTKNSSKHIEKVLNSVEGFDEVVIFDTGSTDNTLEIAKRYPFVSIFQGKLNGFGKTHNEASSKAKNAWILSLDSDEVLTDELRREILSSTLNEHSVYRFSRDNYYAGQWIWSCGWSPDFVTRLYNKSKTQFCNSEVHEKVQDEGMELVTLKGKAIHYSYEKTSDFLNKMQSYSDLFAKQNKGKKKSSPLKALGHGVGAFLKSYVLKRGFMQGFAGFQISVYNGNTAFYKYIKLYEYNNS